MAASRGFVARGRAIPTDPPLLMGILNINDDSFSGDGRVDVEWAVRRAREILCEGATILDVGAESARTNRAAIPAEEEIGRLLPFLERFHGEIRPDFPECVLSINTWRPEVAEAALAAGGELLNDMSALPEDTHARICAEHGAALLLMHSVGQPKVAHREVAYDDLFGTLDPFFEQRIARALGAGLSPEALILDPGIDFAKQREDNLRLLRHANRLNRFGRPVLLPISRKTVIGETLGREDARDRDPGTVACLAAGVRAGASIFRVHHVRAMRLALDALRCVEAVAR